MSARGVLYVHSVLPAVVPHVEWALSGQLGQTVCLDWAPQAVSPGMLRARAEWSGTPGTAGRVVSALMGWPIRFEVTEDASPGADAARYSFTPSLGLFTAAMSANGDIVVGEQRLRALLDSGEDVASGLDRLLGAAWDAELEAFRRAGDGAPVRWLHQVG